MSEDIVHEVDSDIDKEIARVAKRVAKGSVIAIIGPDLLKISHEALQPLEKEVQQRSQELQDHNGRMPFIEFINLARVEEEGTEYLSLNEAYLGAEAKTIFLEDTHTAITEAISKKSHHLFIESFEKLAKISTMKFFINASYYNFLDELIKKYRGKCDVFNFEDDDQKDIPLDRVNLRETEPRPHKVYSALKDPLIYNVAPQHDQLSDAPLPIVDDSYIDMVFRIKDAETHLNTLRDILGTPNLTFLFLGFAYSEWQFKFFLKALIGKDLTTLKESCVNITEHGYWGADPRTREQEMTATFETKNLRTFYGISSQDFIARLFSKLRNDYPDVLTDDLKNQLVFVSYASDNGAIANGIVKQLEREEIDQWFDESQIEYGNTFTDKIKAGIDRSCLVLALVTPESIQRYESEAKSGSAKPYFQLEWEYALDRESNGSYNVEVIPVLLGDDTTLRLVSIFERKSYIKLADDGLLPQSAITQLRTRQQEARR